MKNSAFLILLIVTCSASFGQNNFKRNLRYTGGFQYGLTHIYKPQAVNYSAPWNNTILKETLEMPLMPSYYMNAGISYTLPYNFEVGISGGIGKRYLQRSFDAMIDRRDSITLETSCIKSLEHNYTLGLTVGKYFMLTDKMGITLLVGYGVEKKLTRDRGAISSSYFRLDQTGLCSEIIGLEGQGMVELGDDLYKTMALGVSYQISKKLKINPQIYVTEHGTKDNFFDGNLNGGLSFFDFYGSIREYGLRVNVEFLGKN